MADIPLSRMTEINDAIASRDALITKIELYERLITVAGYYKNDGTESEPLPDAIVPAVRRMLIDMTRQELAAVEADLRDLGVDPQA